MSQCLHSVKLAIDHLQQEAEVFVVDNHSVDGSVQLIRKSFPWVKLIVNTDNVGFSRANNQAIRQAKGEYILLLNPDTVVEQDTFVKTVSFLDSRSDIGGLGVRMIDGKGNFLPESKRGLPTPEVAFYKISGLSKLFPKSKKFNRYHLGFLSEWEIHEVDVLSGAFMMLRKSVLDKIGLLDEDFFMYGEDIDMSYRITLAGFKNVYFPHTTIIHYKGESTKKGSINYVRTFYSAMAIFAQKHFQSKQGQLFSKLINIAIWLRASLSLFKRILLKVLSPLIDFIFFFLIFLLVTFVWQQIKFHGEATYPDEFLWYVLPVYSLLFVFSLYYTGLYSQKSHWFDLFKGLGIGSLLILSLYALLSEDLRYSRAIVLFGILFSFIVFPLFRYLLSSISFFKVGTPKKKRAVVIGSEMEYNRISQLLTKTNAYEQLLWVSATAEHLQSIGKISDLEEIARIHKIHELIFSSLDLSPKAIIELMTKLSELQLDYKIVGDAVIGSKTVYTSEPAFDVYINAIVRPVNKRNKRFFDLLTSILLLFLSPLLLFVFKNRFNLLKNILKVLSGKYSWIGYAHPVDETLPKIKPGVIPVTFSYEEHRRREINLLYAKDYKISFEIMHFLKYFGHIAHPTT